MSSKFPWLDRMASRMSAKHVASTSDIQEQQECSEKETAMIDVSSHLQLAHRAAHRQRLHVSLGLFALGILLLAVGETLPFQSECRGDCFPSLMLTL